MTKKEFIERLERNLSALKAEDRENALAFYEEYFDEAGEGAESAAAEELGSPEKLAEEILSFYKASYSGEHAAAIRKSLKDDIRQLVFETKSSNIYIAASPAGVFEYKLENIPEEDIEVKIENGVFTVNEESALFFSKKGFGDFIKNFTANVSGVWKIKRKIYVYIPKNLLIEKAEFHSHFGSVKMEEVNIKITEASLSCGSIHCKDCRLEDMNLNTSAGSVKLASVTADKIKLHTAAGSVKCESVGSSEIRSSTGAGSISFSNCTAAFLQISSGAGSVFTEKVRAEKCGINTGAGSCKINACDLKTCTISSGAGSIKAEGFLYGQTRISSSIGSVILSLDDVLDRYDIRFAAERSKIRLNGTVLESKNGWNSAGNPEAENKISASVQFGSIIIKTKERPCAQDCI